MHKLKPEYIKLTKNNRLYNSLRPIIGLTGGIATGKSTVSSILKDSSFDIIDADKLIKLIYKEEESISFIRNISPEFIEDGSVNFKKLRSAFFSSTNIQKTVESYLYSKLPETFIEIANQCKNSDFLIYDVPLLFEKNIHSMVDVSILVYSPKELQKDRLMKRDLSTSQEADLIISKQLDIESKRSLSTFVIDNSGSIEDLNFQIEELINVITDT